MHSLVAKAGILWGVCGLVLCLAVSSACGDFAPIFDGRSKGLRYTPYLQHPTSSGVTVMWFSVGDEAGAVHVKIKGEEKVWQSRPVPAPEISNGWTEKWRPARMPVRYCHEVRVAGLRADTVYAYRVTDGRDEFAGNFRTAPAPEGKRPMRIIAFADAETEPIDRREKVLGKPYPLTNDQGFAANVKAVLGRKPDLLLIAGDLVQHGGEQEDWERFFAHVNGDSAKNSLAGQIPIVAALGNHDYYGPKYSPPGSELAVAKFLTYFSNPRNGSPVKAQQERYYRLDYGAVAIIVLDCNNGPDGDPDRDTNQYGLVGEGQPGGVAPDWVAGSRQHAWLVKQLQDAQQQKAFTFVVFHYAPYSSGPHGLPAGRRGEKGKDGLSGFPLRELDALFHKYGVQLVLSGHDEMLEASATKSKDGRHTVYYWDVGIAGDGLRAPKAGAHNPAQIFIAHNSPQGKHYGFLQVDLAYGREGWAANVRPYWINPAAGGIGGAYDIRLQIPGRSAKGR